MNLDYLNEQFRLLKEYLRRVRSIAHRSKTEFLGDVILVDAAIRELTVLYETAHNIAKHLIKERGWKVAKSKAEAFEILHQNGVLTSELCEAFRQASRFRNLVTYQTPMIDNDVVYDIVAERLSDFEEFASCVSGWIERNPGG